MQTQIKRRIKAGACLLFAAAALAGCGSRHAGSAAGPSGTATPVQVQQTAQQQAAQRAAYFNSHPTSPNQPPAASPYRGHP